MKYALVNDDLQEAQPGLVGKCKSCGSSVIAKCGRLKIWHWAHSGKRACDPWKENETAWHRAWKRQFPKEYQEVIQYSESGEKHIADVKIEQGYVVEFQRSPIKLEERQAREDFYKQMIWIVDGTRRSSDRDKFIDVLKYSELVDGNVNERRIRSNCHRCPLLRDWNSSDVPVFFDFDEDILWCLLPIMVDGRIYVFRVERNMLVASLLSVSQMNGIDKLLKGWAHSIGKDVKYQRRKEWERLPPLLRGFQPEFTSYPIRRRT